MKVNWQCILEKEKVLQCFLEGFQFLKENKKKMAFPNAKAVVPIGQIKIDHIFCKLKMIFKFCGKTNFLQVEFLEKLV